MEVHRRNRVEEPSTKPETFTIYAIKMILKAVHRSIKAIIDDDIAEARALETRIGGVVPGGAFDESWTRFSAVPDIDSTRKCMVEIARFLQYHGTFASGQEPPPHTCCLMILIRSSRRSANRLFTRDTGGSEGVKSGEGGVIVLPLACRFSPVVFADYAAL
ncbi:hypothetical protein O988_00096 [Pseudogymnoascus sp. VKM F-3808]|nr:hypothetical protein O988_00096 [Pseudogymnoascus sp. VKM F-3808]